MAGVGRWNKVIEKAVIPLRLKVPHKAFHRNVGALAGVKVSPEGKVMSETEWNANADRWLPSAEDRGFVASLMRCVVEPGGFAGWIAPPMMGINRQPVDFEYVRRRKQGLAWSSVGEALKKEGTAPGDVLMAQASAVVSAARQRLRR